ncbi:DUF86 domain-containing protein [Nocardioides sp.]|uniref:HepT-like ribonuclease domain-containing protein n=1 Tax=Nocardioides sp. TaxID=35761 RepID=UPI0035149007
MSADPAGRLGRTYGERTAWALSEILRACETGAHLVHRGRAWFDDDPDGVPWLAAENLVIRVGENVARLDPRFCADHPAVPWRVIKDMRNRLTHYYEATDHDVVWSTLAADFPILAAQIRDLLEQA